MPVQVLFVWLLLVLASGWLFFPLARQLFGDALPDGGLQVGRIVFSALWTMLAFWLGFLGVATSVSAGLYAIFAVIGLALWWRDSKTIKGEWKQRQRAMLSSEVVFLSVFLIFFILRGFWSDAAPENGEKGMDSALIGSLARASHLPPPNPYAAGSRLQAYYYFGHLNGALWTEASHTTVRWSYNLLCATLPALCFATLFSLGAALTGRLRGGAFVSGAVLLLGTLQPLFQWTHQDQWATTRFLGLDGFAVSRVIPYSINEFPFFTFNQGDLHAHYFSFPLQLALMSVAWAIFKIGKRPLLVVAALLLGAVITTNTWDFPAYMIVVGLALVIGSRRPWLRAAGVIGIAAAALALASPFLLHLTTAANPPRRLAQPASPLREWLLLWGVFLNAWWLFSAYTTFREAKVWRQTVLYLGVGVWAIAIFAPWIQESILKIAHQPIDPTAIFAEWGVSSVLVLPLICISLALAVLGAFKNEGSNRFICYLAIGGLLAILWSETTWAGFLGAPDHLGFDDFKRQDTVFKFGLQGWMLWGTASATGAYLSLKRWPQVFRWAFLPALALMLVSSVAVVHLKAHGFDLSLWQGGDARAHLAAPEIEAAQWLEAHVPPDENLLEAEAKLGGDYSNYTRYADTTGIPTIIGPQAHSFQWSPANAVVTPLELEEKVAAQRQIEGQQNDPNPRSVGAIKADVKAGKEWDEVFARKKVTREIFTNPASPDSQQALKTYAVRYIVWGELERTEYGEAAYANLGRNFTVAARFGADFNPHSVVIFQVPQNN